VENKIRKTIYFVCLTILSGFIQNVLAQNSCSDENFRITATLSENKYSLTQEIENLFKQSLTKIDKTVIYTKVPRGLIVSIDSTVFFDGNDDELKESSKQFLDKIGEILQFLDKSCVIEGNTKIVREENSIYNSNWEISMVRAQKITEYLIKCHHVNPQKIRSIGFGGIMPFKENVFYNGSLNQRIDFVILNYENDSIQF